VLFIRFWLDALASIVFLLKGESRSFLAVWQGRREFSRIKKEFRADRAANLAATRLEEIPEMYQGSLLVAYYLRHVRTFENLMLHA